MVNLKNLSLRNNQIGRIFILKIQNDTFSDWSGSEKYNLKFYLKLFCFYLVQLPDCFGQLKKLENIQLGQNQLHALPSSFASLSGLRHLTLSNNRFTTIPEQILNLHNLQLLDLSGNQITQIPDQIQTIQVDELNLNDNRVKEVCCFCLLLFICYFLDQQNFGSCSFLSSIENITSWSKQSHFGCNSS